VIAERDADLEANRHAHPVLAVQQHPQEPGQVHVAHHPHAVLVLVLAVAGLDLGHGLGVPLAEVAGQVEPGRQVRVDHVRGHRARPGRAGHVQRCHPRKCGRALHLGLVEPAVAAEHLVRGLPRQRHGRVEAARQQHAAGNVRDELPPDDVVQQLPDVGHGLVPAVGVRPGLQLPVDPLAQAGAVRSRIITSFRARISQMAMAYMPFSRSATFSRHCR
jgi:hypothetical protein